MELQNFVKVNNKEVYRFEKFMKKFFSNKKLSTFKKLLASQNAIISGGSVTRAIIDPINVRNWDLTDLDIYVNARNVLPIKVFLKSISKNNFIQGVDKLYSDSFLSRNRIIKVIRFNINKENHIDLMIVRNNRLVTDVVRNFDLSCCKNYYNGKNIFSLDYHNLKKMETSLNPEYLEFYTKKNEIIQNRLFKYASRGFRINIPKLEKNKLKNLSEDKDLTVKYIQKAVFDLVMNTCYSENEFFGIFVGNESNLYNWDNEEDDGFDYEDFTSVDDYVAIKKGDKFKYVIKIIEDFFSTLKKHYFQKTDFQFGKYIYEFKKMPIYCNEERLERMWNALNLLKKEKTSTTKIKSLIENLSIEEKEALKKLL